MPARSAEARVELSGWTPSASALDDPEWAAVAGGRTGWPTCIDGEVQPGLARVIVGRPRGRARQGWESTGVTAFREAATAAAAALDYAACRALDRRGRALRRFDRAIALRARDAGDAGDGLVGRRGPDDAQRRARRAIVDKGCRRGAATARWALGYVSMSRGELDEATHRADRGARVRDRRARRSSSSCRRCGVWPRSPCRPATRTARSPSVARPSPGRSRSASGCS